MNELKHWLTGETNFEEFIKVDNPANDNVYKEFYKKLNLDEYDDETLYINPLSCFIDKELDTVFCVALEDNGSWNTYYCYAFPKKKPQDIITLATYQQLSSGEVLSDKYNENYEESLKNGGLVEELRGSPSLVKLESIVRNNALLNNYSSMPPYLFTVLYWISKKNEKNKGVKGFIKKFL